jgi:anthranilate synthase component 1
LALPDAILLRPTITAVFDNVRDEILVVTPVWPQAGVDARAAYATACERLMDAVGDLERPAPATPAASADLPANSPVESNISHDEYLAIVDRAKEYIRAGDVFQVVPSQRFRRPFSLPPFSLYRALRRLNPSPFLYHLAFPGFSIVGSSPEILVRLRGRLRARAPEAVLPNPIARLLKSSCATLRSGPNISCSSISAAMMSVEWPRPEK